MTTQFARLLISAFVVFLVTASSAAWEFGTDGGVFWTGVQEAGGRKQMVFFCSQALPGVVQLQVFTDEPGPANSVDVNLFVDTSEGSFGPIPMKARSQNGNLTIATTGMDIAAMNAAQSVYAEVETVALSYYESTWHFPGANYSDSFGAMLDACG